MDGSRSKTGVASFATVLLVFFSVGRFPVAAEAYNICRCFPSRLAACVHIQTAQLFRLAAWRRKIASLKLKRRHIFVWESIESKRILHIIITLSRIILPSIPLHTYHIIIFYQVSFKSFHRISARRTNSKQEFSFNVFWELNKHKQQTPQQQHNALSVDNIDDHCNNGIEISSFQQETHRITTQQS